MKRIIASTIVAAGCLALPIHAAAEARVLVVHAAPFADSLEGTSVTVSVNGDPVLQEFEFGEFTEYLDLPAGDYDLAVTPTGADDPAIETSVSLESGSDYTVLAVGNGQTQPLELWALLDDAEAPADGDLNIRVVHAAPFAEDLEATEVSIRTAGGDVVNDLTGVPYQVQSGFFAVPAGEYDLKVASSDGQTNLIDPLPATLPAGADVTLVAIGDGINQPLGILAIPVGTLETRTPVDNSVNGWWESVEGESEGFVLTPLPAQNRLLGTVYTYDLDGSGQPQWFTFDTCQAEVGEEGCPVPGGFDGTSAVGSLYSFSGGLPGGGAPVDGQTIGTIALEFVDCDTAEAAVALEDGTELTWSLDRLTSSVPCTLD